MRLLASPQDKLVRTFSGGMCSRLELINLSANLTDRVHEIRRGFFPLTLNVISNYGHCIVARSASSWLLARLWKEGDRFYFYITLLLIQSLGWHIVEHQVKKNYAQQDIVGDIGNAWDCIDFPSKWETWATLLFLFHYPISYEKFSKEKLC